MIFTISLCVCAVLYAYILYGGYPPYIPSARSLCGIYGLQLEHVLIWEYKNEQHVCSV